MKKMLQRIHRRQGITRSELTADAIFIGISALVAFIAVFIFDVHHSFYPGNSIFAPKFIFDSPAPYLFAVPGGALVGFFLFKIAVYGFMLEEKAMKKR